MAAVLGYGGWDRWCHSIAPPAVGWELCAAVTGIECQRHSIVPQVWHADETVARGSEEKWVADSRHIGGSVCYSLPPPPHTHTQAGTGVTRGDENV